MITASLPENVAGVPVDQLWLCYLAVLMFSIFFLNIFIGVIGELYQVEKMRSELTFQELRCQSVLSFQLRALILPCALCDATVAQGIALASFCVIAGTQMLLVRLLEDDFPSKILYRMAIPSRNVVLEEPFGSVRRFCIITRQWFPFLPL